MVPDMPLALIDPVACSDLQVRIPRHAYFDMQPSHRPQRDMESARNTRDEFDFVAVLIGIDLQRLVQHIALIFDTKFDLLASPVVTVTLPSFVSTRTLARFETVKVLV